MTCRQGASSSDQAACMPMNLHLQLPSSSDHRLHPSASDQHLRTQARELLTRSSHRQGRGRMHRICDVKEARQRPLSGASSSDQTGSATSRSLTAAGASACKLVRSGAEAARSRMLVMRRTLPTSDQRRAGSCGISARSTKAVMSSTLPASASPGQKVRDQQREVMARSRTHQLGPVPCMQKLGPAAPTRPPWGVRQWQLRLRGGGRTPASGCRDEGAIRTQRSALERHVKAQTNRKLYQPLPTTITDPLDVRVLTHKDVDEVNATQEEENLEEEWVQGLATRSYVCESSHRLMYTVEVNGEIVEVPFGEIQTLYSHCESENEEDNLNWAEDFELLSISSGSESDKELDLLLLKDDIGREGSEIFAYNSEIHDEIGESMS